MADTNIEWTDRVWNPTTGCDRVSPGCDHCYALTLARRLKAMGQAKYQRDGDPRTSGPGFGLSVHPDAVNLPLRWRRPSKVFVNSMSDLFHADVPTPWLADIFAVMAVARRHTFQVLTKRPARMRSLLSSLEFVTAVFGRALGKGMTRAEWTWPLPNLWPGVSAEDQHWATLRLPALPQIPAAVRWVSVEPMLGPMDLRPWLPSLGWVVLGGESGPGARPMDPAWAESVVAQCQATGTPVLVKQLGSAGGRKHHHDITTFPPLLQVREYPERPSWVGGTPIQPTSRETQITPPEGATDA